MREEDRVRASPVLEKAQASGSVEGRDPLRSHWPRAGSLSRSHDVLFGGAWVPLPTEPTPRADPAPQALPLPHWDAVLGTGDLAGSRLYFWHRAVATVTAGVGLGVGEGEREANWRRMKKVKKKGKESRERGREQGRLSVTRNGTGEEGEATSPATSPATLTPAHLDS